MRRAPRGPRGLHRPCRPGSGSRPAAGAARPAGPTRGWASRARGPGRAPGHRARRGHCGCHQTRASFPKHLAPGPRLPRKEPGPRAPGSREAGEARRPGAQLLRARRAGRESSPRRLRARSPGSRGGRPSRPRPPSGAGRAGPRPAKQIFILAARRPRGSRGWGARPPRAQPRHVAPEPRASPPRPHRLLTGNADKLNTAGITAICSGYRCRY